MAGSPACLAKLLTSDAATTNPTAKRRPSGPQLLFVPPAPEQRIAGRVKTLKTCSGLLYHCLLSIHSSNSLVIIAAVSPLEPLPIRFGVCALTRPVAAGLAPCQRLFAALGPARAHTTH